jgi:hypothetical protein
MHLRPKKSKESAKPQTFNLSQPKNKTKQSNYIIMKCYKEHLIELYVHDNLCFCSLFLKFIVSNIPYSNYFSGHCKKKWQTDNFRTEPTCDKI